MEGAPGKPVPRAGLFSGVPRELCSTCVSAHVRSESVITLYFVFLMSYRKDRMRPKIMGNFGKYEIILVLMLIIVPAGQRVWDKVNRNKSSPLECGTRKNPGPAVSV